MAKVFRLIVCVLLAVLLGMAGVLAGCSGGNDEEERQETDFSLVSDGRSDYEIVIAENATTLEKTAATELELLFYEATGVHLPIRTDGDYNKSKPYISLGYNALLSDEMRIGAAGLSESGYRMLNEGQNVFMFGPLYGTLYAVYDFMNYQFGFEQFAANCYSLEKGVKDKKLFAYDDTVEPDFTYRIKNFGMLTGSGDKNLMNRLRYHTVESTVMGLKGQRWHNYFTVVPKTQYEDEHFDWFSEDGTQLCLTRDPEGLEKLFLAALKEAVIQYPEISIFSMTQNDTTDWCDCKKCSDLYQKYGTDAAAMIQFTNRVDAKFQEWLRQEYPDREVHICVFAYLPTEKPPVKETSEGVFEVIDNSVRLNDGIYVVYAPISANMYYAFDDIENEIIYDNIRGWSAVTDQLMIWTYNQSYYYYMGYFDNFNSMQANAKILKESGAVWWYDQGQWNANNSTAFNTLKCYLSSKLAWDVDTDIGAATERFFANYFGEASDIMLTLFNNIRVWYAHLVNEGVYVPIPQTYFDTTQGSLFKYGVLKGWLDQIDAAYSAIEPLKNTEGELYSLYRDRINTESIFIRYCLINNFSAYFQSDVLADMKQEFKSDCEKLNINLFSETKNISTLWTTWGI